MKHINLELLKVGYYSAHYISNYYVNWMPNIYDTVRTYNYSIGTFVIHTGIFNNPDLIPASEALSCHSFCWKYHMKLLNINSQITGGWCVAYYISPSGSKWWFPLAWISLIALLYYASQDKPFFLPGRLCINSFTFHRKKLLCMAKK